MKNNQIYNNAPCDHLNLVYERLNIFKQTLFVMYVTFKKSDITQFNVNLSYTNIFQINMNNGMKINNRKKNKDLNQVLQYIWESPETPASLLFQYSFPYKLFHNQFSLCTCR